MTAGRDHVLSGEAARGRFGFDFGSAAGVAVVIAVLLESASREWFRVHDGCDVGVGELRKSTTRRFTSQRFSICGAWPHFLILRK